MAALNVYYALEHDEHPIVIGTTVEADALVEQVRAESPEDAPTLMQLYVTDDLYGQELCAGIRGDRGVLRYSGPESPGGVFSLGTNNAGPDPLAYFYMDTHTEFPPNAEIPLTTVRHAIHHYLTTAATRPTTITWQPNTRAEP